MEPRRYNRRLWYGPLIPFCFFLSRRFVLLGKWLLFKSVQGRCAYCGKADGKLTIDHVKPVSRFKDLGLSNWLPACKTCNFLKDNFSISTFRRRTVGTTGLFFFEDGVEKDIVDHIKRGDRIDPINKTLRERLKQMGVLFPKT